MAETQSPGNGPIQGQNGLNVETTQQAPTQAETTDLSSKFAHLARKEKIFREQQRKFQTERQSWEQQREAQRAQIEAEIYSRYAKDPIGFSRERGLTEDQLGSLLLNQQYPEANHIFQLQQENKDLRTQIEKINKRFEENETTSVNQALHQIGVDTKQLIASNKEQFELISAAGEDGIEAVKSLCKVMWDEDQVLLSVQEAAEMVEQELLDRSMAFASAKKVQAKLAPPPTTQAEGQKIPNQTLKAATTTTLNSQAAQATSKPLSARERAIRAFKGQL